ncbi:Smr/MutS family protein [Pseudogemmobacter bohemicus]|uniref:Smr/MutS family protein n=1 Tax=Pseudogemmobacter bohemicus TaxID=2250708 RepID=UPI000DD478FE|nr:Smr/MutS family protein [Pseudogemmobacter bohemicus]
MARRRQLRPEERDLWQAVARTLRPMHGALPEDVAQEAIVPKEGLPPAVPPPPREAVLPRFRLGEKAAPTAKPAPQPVLRMDAGLHKKMIRGKIAPEARIDLHGMTLSVAHPELIAFLFSAQASGKRLVLVITGKGKQVYEPVPRPIGALRHQVPHWLRLPPLSAVVQEVTEAHLRHGGTGAFYVWLRRG